MTLWVGREGRWWILSLPLLVLGACTNVPQRALPEAGATAQADAKAPFMPIFGRHPATVTGGGALPTAEAAVVKAMTFAPSADHGLPIDRHAALAVRALLTAPGVSTARPVEDVLRALALIERTLNQFFDAQRETVWFGNALTILAGLRSELARVDKDLARLEGDDLPLLERVALSDNVRLALPMILAGRDTDSDTLPDPHVDLAGLLQLRDVLGYPAVVDGEDWNCRVLPPSLESDLAVYRQAALWCGRPATADGVPQS